MSFKHRLKYRLRSAGVCFFQKGILSSSLKSPPPPTFSGWCNQKFLKLVVQKLHRKVCLKKWKNRGLKDISINASKKACWYQLFAGPAKWPIGRPAGGCLVSHWTGCLPSFSRRWRNNLKERYLQIINIFCDFPLVIFLNNITFYYQRTITVDFW